MPALAGPIWATCLREVAFPAEELSQEDKLAVKEVDTHYDDVALVFLLEILCGLKSPVLGETEVLGQFKTFVNSLPADHALRRETSLLPFLMNTVKEARTKFLSATGSLTYGQIVRRWLKESNQVVLVGFGSLGSEIYPWIREKTQTVVVRQMREATDGVPFSTTLPKLVADAVVIAAPVSDDYVLKLAESSFVIDLRERALSGHANVKNLADLFREIRELRQEREETVPRCQEFLAKKALEYMARHQIRPFGWEDLCG